MNKARRVLHVKVGESVHESAARAAAAMKALDAGRPVPPYFGVSFARAGAMLAAFTPRRWELIAALRESGPLTIAELARRLGRNYKNVHSDVSQLIDWMAIERLDDGRIRVPWSEIVVGMKLPDRAAA
jgi:predicted transcriptional regulator